MHELDAFLRDWITPVTRRHRYLKAGRTYRHGYPGADWGLVHFRDFPIDGFRCHFQLSVAYVPAPLFDWHNFRSPDIATAVPGASWMDWSVSLNRPRSPWWGYRTEDDRARCGTELQDRADSAIAAITHLDENRDQLLAAVLSDQPRDFGLGHFFPNVLKQPMWAVCLLAARGPSEELEQALSRCDPYPALKARAWVHSFHERNEIA